MLFAMTAGVALTGATAYAVGSGPRTPPGQPTSLSAKAGDQQVVLSWGPPSSDGSAPIDHYTVSVSPGGQSLQTKSMSATIAGLTNQTTYTFNVTATNQDDQTGPAAVANATPVPPPFLTLVPAFGPGDQKINVSGHQFTPNQAITLDWDGDQTVVVGSAQADTGGAFNVDVRPPANAAAAPHRVCATVDPQPCGDFTLTGPGSTPSTAPLPTPSPSPSPSASSGPSPSPSPSLSPAPTLTGFDLISRPPFVFLPILAVVALLGAIAFWIFGRRPPPSLPSATVMHRSVRPELGPPAFGAATAAAAPPPPVATPPAPEPPLPEPPAPELPPPAPPSGPSAPDEPPDLPEPGE
jgi:Fibronectin type III domain